MHRRAALGGYVVMAVVAALCVAVLVSLQHPALVLLSALVALLAVLALVAPQWGVVATMLVGALTPYYLSTSVSGLPMGLSGLVVTAALMGLCAIGMAIRVRPDRRVLPYAGIVAGLLLAWLLGPLGMIDAPKTTTRGLLAGMSGTEVAIGAATLAFCATRRGREALLRAWMVAGCAAAVAAVVEFVLRRNLLLEIALRYGQGEKWTEVPSRFGLARVAGAFGHPILLGCFLGAAMLTTLELARRRLLTERTAVLVIALMFVGQAATLSRGPFVSTVAILAGWALLSWPMKTWRRVILLATIVSCATLLVVEVAFSGDIINLVRPSQSELGETSMHRVGLMEAFFSELKHPTLSGTNPETLGILEEFGQTIDHEWLYVLVTRGAIGLLALGGLVVGPVVVAAVRERGRWLDKLFPIMTAAYLVLVGSTVAFFGQWLLFVFVLTALSWLTLLDSKSGDVQADGDLSRLDERLA